MLHEYVASNTILKAHTWNNQKKRHAKYIKQQFKILNISLWQTMSLARWDTKEVGSQLPQRKQFPVWDVFDKDSLEESKLSS